MYDLGVIGVGNMGGAILNGTLNADVLEPSKVIIYEREVEKTLEFLEKNVRMANSENEVAAYSKIILLAVKPTAMKTLGEKIKANINEEAIIVSIAAGVSIDDLKEYFGENHRYVRVMPNTPALINEGMTAIVPGNTVHMDDLKMIIKLFESVGRTTILSEDKIDAFAGATSCMPAFVYIFIESAADAAIKNGLTRREAYEFISQALIGSAKMVLETDKHPGELKDQVTSPLGSTIRGVMALEREGFRNAVITAVDEATMASKKLN